MLKNYLKTAFRNHIKNKWNSLINVFSLAIGVACCILIFVFVYHELSFDRFHENAEDIYRIYYRAETNENETLYSPLNPHSMVAEFNSNYPGVKKATSFQRSGTLIQYEDKKFDENFALVDSTFLTMFSFPLTVGNPEKALVTTDQVVITEEIADKFFGDLNNDYSQVIGKVLSFYHGTKTKEHIITGVLKPLPKSSSLQFGLAILKEGNNFYYRSDDATGELSLYLQLEKGADAKAVEASLAPLIPKYHGEVIQYLRENGILKDTDDCVVAKLQPLLDIYFNQNIESSYEAKSNKMYSYILGGIGLLILTLACINFITLSLGHALTRTNEIGIRKVLGAGKKQIVVQHSVEKIVLIVLALVIGYILSELFLPTFNQLSQKDLSISLFGNPGLALFMFAVLVVSGFFAAGIPALTMSRINPSGVLQAVAKLGGKSRVNAIFVISQFFLSILLLTSAMMISRQVSFMLNKDLGFDKEEVLVIPILTQYSDLYRNKILNYPEIISACGCDRNFTNGSSTRDYYTDAGKPVSAQIIRVQEDYIKTLGIELLEGRNFSEEFPGDKVNSVIVNETLVKELELERTLGMTLTGHKFDEQIPQIIGVVKDYHVSSLRQKIDPLILHMTNEVNGRWSLLVKIRSENIKQTLDVLRKEWREVVPEREFSYRFLDEDLSKKYQAEQRWQKIVNISTLFAFIISSLGLLGLASMVTKSRIKEIGVRKVLGASISGILLLLTKDISRWILIANLIAWPVAWYAMNKWLHNFAYQVGMSPWPFLLAGLVSLAIALLTVSWLAIRAATANPVKALRYE